MSEKKLSEELRESQASKWTQLVNPYAWADRAAALEAEIEELRTIALTHSTDVVVARQQRDALAAENERLRARIAEALDWALCTDDDHLRRILAPEGEDL